MDDPPRLGRMGCPHRTPDERHRTRPATRRRVERCVMSWIILVVSGAFEAVWAVALGKSEGFTRLAPSLVFFPALVVSMGGLAYAMRELPTATSYVIWVGIGATLTAVYSFATGDE